MRLYFNLKPTDTVLQQSSVSKFEIGNRKSPLPETHAVPRLGYVIVKEFEYQLNHSL